MPQWSQRGAGCLTRPLHTPLSTEKTLLGQMHTSVGQMRATKFGQMQLSQFPIPHL